MNRRGKRGSGPSGASGGPGRGQGRPSPQRVIRIQSRQGATPPPPTNAKVEVRRWVRAELVKDWRWVKDGEVGRIMGMNEEMVVVGVVGAQSSGKSTLAQRMVRALDGHGDGEMLGQKWLEVAGEQRLRLGRHQTCGIEMVGSPSGVVVLDCQPVGSVGVWMEMLESTGLPPGVADHLELEQLRSLQMIMFMLAICDVVVLVGEDVDENVFMMLRSAESLLQACETQFSVGRKMFDFPMRKQLATLALVINMVPEREYEEATRLRFENEALGYLEHSGLSIASIGNRYGLYHIARKREPQCFMLPIRGNEGASFDDELDDLVRQLLSCPKPVRPARMTLPEWFTYAQTAWESLTKAPVLKEFNHLWQSHYSS